MNRGADGWEQAVRDVAHAAHALEDGDYEWAAFAAQQAGEKEIKALILAHGGEPWGHSITALVEALPAGVERPVEVVEAANRLDKHYIPARYPNGFASGYPGKLYTRGEAAGAVSDARSLLKFCLSSAGATYLDRRERVEQVRAAVRRAAARMPTLVRAVLFGSLAHGIPTPRSDADLLVVVTQSACPEPRDRVPEVLRALAPLPCPVDLFVLTEEEVERLRSEGSPFLKEVFAHGIDML